MKVIGTIAWVRSSAMAAGIACLCAASVSHALCGDVSGDGKILTGDALRVLKASVGQNVSLICDECPALSVVRGTIWPKAETIEGEGYTATYIPAGTGGTSLGQAEAVNGSNIITKFTPGMPTPGTYVRIDGTYSELYLVTEVPDVSHFKIEGGGYRGGALASESVTIYRGTTLFPGYTITFTTPFQGRPSVTLTTESQTVQGVGEGLFLNSIELDYSAGGVDPSGDSFHAYISQADIPRGRTTPSIPGPANFKWNFIAIGAK